MLNRPHIWWVRPSLKSCVKKPKTNAFPTQTHWIHRSIRALSHSFLGRHRTAWAVRHGRPIADFDHHLTMLRCCPSKETFVDRATYCRPERRSADKPTIDFELSNVSAASRRNGNSSPSFEQCF
jgi:hypothetical protein